MSFFCSGLPRNVVTTVPIPKLIWGVSGNNIIQLPANTQFDVQLIDVTNSKHPLVLDTLTLAQGFPSRKYARRSKG